MGIGFIEIGALFQKWFRSYPQGKNLTKIVPENFQLLPSFNQIIIISHLF